MKLTRLLILLLIILFTACKEKKSDIDYTKLVDPMIGTGGHGHTFPGATVPFGMVQISPDTRWEDWDGSSGYHYSDNTIMGFSQTHLSGTGAPEYCDVLFMPTVGKLQILPGDENDSKTGYRSAFSHKNEKASPGYYSVLLDDYNINAEMTATTRSSMQRYTFPQSNSANIIIDLKNRDHVLTSNIEIISDTEIQGLRKSRRWATEQFVYFYAKFSKPFRTYGIALNDTVVEGIKKADGQNIRAFVQFDTKENEQILVKVGISAVDIEGAKKNLEAESPGWNFEKVVNKAKEEWNTFLSKIEVEGGTEKQRRIFYTGLYHTAIAPNIFMDVDRRYRGVDHQIHKADGFDNYTVFSLWDTFRANMPLYTIIDPARYNEWIKTFLEMYRIGGRLPQWELAGNYTGVMIGYHTHSVILDGYQKGIRDFDAELAFEAMKKRVESISYFNDLGFIPADKVGGSVSMTMEYAYNEWAVAHMAKSLNSEDDFQDYIYRSQFYKNLFDSSTGFMRPKNSEGSWITPFDPAEGSEHFVEGNSYQYSLFAPQDINGLIDLIGGDKKFIAWMDTLFTKESIHDEGAIDATGLIGQYAHGNEPSHHMAYLYNYAGAPWKTQSMVRRILDTMYDDKPNGLSGNEDCGQMSAWYILSAMGFYQVCPGTPDYVIGSPVFDKVTIHLENGKDFTILAKNISVENKYIQAVSLDGDPYTKSWFTHNDILNGTVLSFEMGATPNKNWGVAKEDRPESEKYEQAAILPYAVTDDTYFLDKATVTLKCDDKAVNIYYTTDGSRPTNKSNLYSSPVEVYETTNLRFASYKDGILPSAPVSVKPNKLEFEDFTNYESKGSFKKGLNYKYYHAHVMEENDLDNLTPVETGIIPNFTIEQRKQEDYFGYIYSGYLDVPRDGIYTFSIKVNDKCTLYLDGKEFLHGGFKTIALRKGKYKIDEKYFQLGAKKFNIVSWQGPGFEQEEIPADALFHL
ncbi:GH92 family glycosyl hydrolase [Maribellus maritimus]|uniref:GH92 family glycosyl hydrolase n=1 Tax=Maribellus maritimus TaxID=2870838 RepID=UPI001EEC0C78|nr:GH92 family glycosyl hydrolase [Maribellus maritimus]MCG6186339.1 GH92 family glycosyl hydrolase [Maribellus maritimus]